jgi:hypothetical protein
MYIIAQSNTPFYYVITIKGQIILTATCFGFEVHHPRCVSNKSNVKCIQYDVKHNLVLDGILVY